MRMRIRYSLTALSMIAMLLFTVSASGKDERTEEFDVSPGGTIAFDLESGGSVSIVGWDRSVAKISYVQGGKGHSHDVEISETRDGLSVTSSTEEREGRSRTLHFEIRLPHRFDVEFESMGGSLELEDLEGTFRGRTMGGVLVLRDVEGTVRLTTMGGSMEVTDSELNGKMTTMGGPVLLENVVGDLDATSMGGNVQYKNVRGRDGKRRAPGDLSAREIDEETVAISTMGGDINVDAAPAGAVVHTMGGAIKILDASRFVKAKTMGGDIELRVVDGSVDAVTMAGDIHVVIEEGLGDDKEGVTLSSCCGDIDLTVPSDLSMDLDLTIAYTRNSSQDFEIISDVEIQIERSREWDYENGSPRKRIHGTGRVGGGRHHIRIETINGNIRVRQAD